MTKFSDQNDDLNHQDLHRLIKMYEAPDFVKKASFGAILSPESPLPTRAYALPGSCKYRLDTAPATWVSLAFLMDKKADYSKNEYKTALQRLEDAASFHGISKYTDELIEKVAKNNPIDDNDLPDTDFGYIQINEDGTKERHLRLINPLEVKAAAVFLHKFRNDFTFEDRQHIAERILDKANEYGASLGRYDDFIEKQAGMGDCPASDAAELILNRSKFVNDLATKSELVKMAEVIVKNPEEMHRTGAMTKIASIVDSIDKTYHIEYSENTPRPEDVLFKINRKVAQQIVDEHVSTTTGNLYKKSDISKIPINELEAMMGKDFSERVVSGLHVDPEKLAEQLQILPRPDASLMDRLFNENGIKPQAREMSKAASLTTYDLVQLAKLHKEQQKTTEKKGSNEIIRKENRGSAIASLVSSVRNKR